MVSPAISSKPMMLRFDVDPSGRHDHVLHRSGPEADASKIDTVNPTPCRFFAPNLKPKSVNPKPLALRSQP